MFIVLFQAHAMLSYDKMTTLSVGSQDQLDGMAFTSGTLPYPPHLIKYLEAITPIIANNNSKLGVGVVVSIGLGEGV